MVETTHTLTLSCDDRRGLVADVSGFLQQKQANIIEAQQYLDPDNKAFFMRIEFENAGAEGEGSIKFKDEFAAFAQRNSMRWNIRAKSEPLKVLILVSKLDHCLADLLYRWRRKELIMDIAGIVSNHSREAIGSVLLDDIPFYHMPVSAETKPEQEAQIKALIKDKHVELVVLARYMQILSDDMAAHLSGRCINIHHSFLPGFKGAKPYHQAHKRGVKMIGATAHYVTPDLDEGPIIHQDVENVSHFDTVKDMVRKGRDIEQRVLAVAVRHHLQDRIFLNGERTVVFKA